MSGPDWSIPVDPTPWATFDSRSVEGMQMDRIECAWCKAQNAPERTTCEVCGAPLDARNKVTDSGWREAPRLKDMTEFRFGNSVCQVEGEIVPVAEMNLAQGDAVFFEHHVMLWKDEVVPISTQNTGGGLKRMLGGMPFVVCMAHGAGRIAFSRDATGEVVVLRCSRRWNSTCAAMRSSLPRTPSATRSYNSRA